VDGPKKGVECILKSEPETDAPEAGVEQRQRSAKGRTRVRSRRRSFFSVPAIALPVLLWTAGWGLSLWSGRMAGFRLVSPLAPVRATDVRLLPPADTEEEKHTGPDPAALSSLHSLSLLVVDIADAPLDESEGSLPPWMAALFERPSADPQTLVLVLADPSWSDYRDACPSALRPLADRGGLVVLVDHDQLPDSNLLFTPFRRVLGPVVEVLPWLRNREVSARLGRGRRRPHPLPQVLRFLDLKAVGRRLVVGADFHSDRWAAALLLEGPVCSAVQLRDPVLARTAALAELEVARSCILRRPSACFTSRDLMDSLRRIEDVLDRLDDAVFVEPPGRENAFPGQLLTEGAVGEKIDWVLEAAAAGDRVDVWTSGLTDTGVLRRLERAAARGARVRVVLPAPSDQTESGEDVNSTVAALLRQRAASGRMELRVQRLTGLPALRHTTVVRVHRETASGGFLLLACADLTRKDLRDRNLTCALYFEDAPALDAAIADRFDRCFSEGVDAAAHATPMGGKLLLREALLYLQSFLGVRRF